MVTEPIFNKSGLYVAPNGRGGITFSGAASLSVNEAAELVEALRKWRGRSGVGTHFENRAASFLPLYDDAKNPRD